jgi:hypothetical protein
MSECDKMTKNESLRLLLRVENTPLSASRACLPLPSGLVRLSAAAATAAAAAAAAAAAGVVLAPARNLQHLQR